MTTRTYYVQPGAKFCRHPHDHYDCACAGRGGPEVQTHRPRWPGSLSYVRVRARSEREAVEIATTAGGRSMCGGVGTVRIPVESRGGDTFVHPADLVRADYDV